jgi:C-terminal processing protease CtpA/Prc
MLQTLSTKRIEPQPAEFINTRVMEDLCRMNSPSTVFSDMDLSPWYKSINEIRQTGSVYTLGYAITSPSTLHAFQAKVKHKLVLITDALCYSATDIFAAGFRDHKLGAVLGVHDNTGAGGANVWTHSLLEQLTVDSTHASKYFKKLPYGAEFTVAIRRTLRVGPNAGVPLEDLGVRPDEVWQMTKDDLLNKNRDLISKACEMLTHK